MTKSTFLHLKNQQFTTRYFLKIISSCRLISESEFCAYPKKKIIKTLIQILKSYFRRIGWKVFDNIYPVLKHQTAPGWKPAPTGSFWSSVDAPPVGDQFRWKKPAD